MWKYPPSAILVPVDFGEASAQALRVAASLAARFGGRLRVLHAETIEAPPYFTHEQLATIERERKAARAQAKHFVRQFAERHGVSSAEIQIADAAPVDAIVEEARRVDLVVMGTHGRRGARRWWMGSVAERVIHESGTPVLVVRADQADRRPEEIYGRPLVVSGAPGPAAEAVRLANGLADAFGGSVREPIARCEADVARDSEATLMVVAKAADQHRAPGGSAVEHWIRSCTLPMLFVPTTAAQPVSR
jgi:nucleotide-binding universal stress UspA family protein